LKERYAVALGIAGKWPWCGGLCNGWVVLDQVMQQRHRGIPAGRFGTPQELGTF
jgi:hypothetical protein